MNPILLIDFGSTYTKVTAVDIKEPALLGTAVSYTTIETDLNDGLTKALKILEDKTGIKDYQEKYACSSAAGGLRMVAVGLVPSLTEKAARLACFGAGAKVIKSYAYGLTAEDIKEIETIKPDILLLAGGTDGGNSRNILHNANMLAACQIKFPIIYAGNRNAASECLNVLKGREVYTCENVMQSFDKLNIIPVQEQIRDLFLKQIIQAKGLSAISELISGIMMPTPAAMLHAMELLATGTQEESGIGELLAVDLGGATTDIYSIAKGMPKQEGVVYKGLPEPFAKRTVEGDIGMRYSIHGISDAATIPHLMAMSGLSEEKIISGIDYLSKNTEAIPDNDDMRALDEALAGAAVEIAVNRHTGTMEEVYTPIGKVFAQTGKDLSDVENIILTGGALIHQTNLDRVIKRVLADEASHYLKPKKAAIYQDRQYILAAMGLLAKKYPEAALTLMKKELNKYEFTEQTTN